MLKALVAIAALFLSLSIRADSPSFDYIDIGYNSLDYDFTRLDEGAELKFSKTIGEGFYVAGDIAGTLEGSGTLVVTTVGLGYKLDFSSSTAFFAEIDYADVERDDGDGESNLDGHEITVGVKSQLTKDFEGTIGLEQLDLGYHNDTSVLIGGAYRISNSFAAYVEGRTLSDAHRFSIGMRYNF
jgi:hypothetical protein